MSSRTLARLALAPCFEQQDTSVRVLAQSMGEHAAGGSRADDDVVEFPFHPGPLVPRRALVYAGEGVANARGTAGRRQSFVARRRAQVIGSSLDFAGFIASPYVGRGPAAPIQSRFRWPYNSGTRSWS